MRRLYASPGWLLGALDVETHAREMYVEFAETLVASAQHDLVRSHCDEPARDRVATGVVRRDAHVVADAKSEQRHCTGVAIGLRRRSSCGDGERLRSRHLPRASVPD